MNPQGKLRDTTSRAFSFFRLLGAVVVGIGIFYSSECLAQTIDPTFTYQGKLSRSGQAATGQFDFVFSFWNDAAAGTQVGTNISKAAVQVKDGIFSVALPGGVDIFSGEKRWLAISVRPTPASGTTAESYVALPRQEITPAPYAVTALNTSGVPNGMKEFLQDGTFTVPNGTTRIMVDMLGANGGAAPFGNPSPGSIFGGPGYLRHVLSVTPGENLQIVVGVAGTPGIYLYQAHLSLSYAVGWNQPPGPGSDSKIIRGTETILYVGGQGAGTAQFVQYGEPIVTPGTLGEVDPKAMIRKPGVTENAMYRMIPIPNTNGNGYVFIQW